MKRKVRRYDWWDIKNKIKDVLNCLFVLALIVGTIYLFYIILKPEMGAELIQRIKELFR